MTELLKVKDLKGYYRPRFGKQVKAVDGISLGLSSGEILGIAGESGCGKSTLAQCMMGMFNQPLTYVDGSILINGQDLIVLDQEEKRREILGKKISYIPQSAMNALNPTIKIKKFIWDLFSSHMSDLSREEMIERAEQRMTELGLPRRVLDNYACQLSGGMKQRVIVMISSLLNPDVLIADEPTSALDVNTQKALVIMMKKLIDDNIVKSIVFITHDLTTLRHVCDRIVIMYAGELVEVGTVDQIVFDPAHPYTKALISSILVPEAEIRGKELITIPGTPPDLKNLPEGCRFAERCFSKNNQCYKEHSEMIINKNRLVRCALLAEREGGQAVNE